MILSVERVSKSYGDVRALEDVSLTLEKGAVLGLLGINGAGKSTLIRMIAGLEKPDRGALVVLDRDPVEEPVVVRGMLGYMSERRNLYEWMSVEETIRFVGSFYRRWDASRASELQKRFALPGDRKVGALSRGQYARLSFLLTLGHRPPLLLLDEPSYGLDPIVRRDFLSVIAEVVADDEATILMASHLINEVERIATHVAIIHHGKLLLSQTVERTLAETRLIDAPHGFDTSLLDGRIIRSVPAADGRVLTVRATDEELRGFLPSDYRVRAATLEDIFCDYASGMEEIGV